MEVSIGSNTPLKVLISVKRRPRGYARQSKGRRECFNFEHLFHNSRVVELTPPPSSH